MGTKRKLLVGGLAIALATPIALSQANADTPTTPQQQQRSVIVPSVRPMPASPATPEGDGEISKDINSDPAALKAERQSAAQAGLPTPAASGAEVCNKTPTQAKGVGNVVICAEVNPEPLAANDPRRTAGAKEYLEQAKKVQPSLSKGAITKSGASTSAVAGVGAIKPLAHWPPSSSFIPRSCLGDNHNSGAWSGARNNTCLNRQVTYRVKDVDNGEEVGGWLSFEYMYWGYSWNNHSYKVRWAAEMFGPWGVMWTPGVLMMSPSFVCRNQSSHGRCTLNGQVSLPTPLFLFQGYTYGRVVSAWADKGRKQIVDIATYFSIYFYQSLVPTPTRILPSMIRINEHSPIARCDNLGRVKAGCVWKGTTSVFNVNYNRPKSREWAHHVWEQQLALPDHWGLKPGTRDSGGNLLPAGTVLSYQPSKTMAAKNRKITCPKPTAHEKHLIHQGKSCDEYPFASTYQGGYYVGAYRTHKKYINHKHNLSGGGLTSAFYRQNRLKAHDKFWISVYAGRS